MENINIDRVGNDLEDAYEEGYQQGLKENEEKMAEEKIIYVIYDWVHDEIKGISHNKNKALATVGFDIARYDCLEINLDEIKD